MRSTRFLKSFIDQTHLIKKQMAETHLNSTRTRVHELRITTRRIRAALWLAKHSSFLLKVEKPSAKLRKLGHALGKVRELDVAIRDADDYHINTKKLKKKRRNACKVLFKQTNSKHRQMIIDDLNAVFLKLREHPEPMVQLGMVSLQKRIRPWTRNTPKTEEDFHQLRIIAKKTRYCLELLGKPTQPLRELQNILGKGHDLEVLQSFSKKNKSWLQTDTRKQYKKARPLVKPAIQFTVHQLSSKKKY